MSFVVSKTKCLPANRNLILIYSFNQISPLIIKTAGKKNGMRSLSNSKLMSKEPVSSLPWLNTKHSSKNILVSDDLSKLKRQEGKFSNAMLLFKVMIIPN